MTQVPMFWPMMMGMAAAMDTAPVERESACKMPTDAEEDWMIAVSRAPTSTPRIGLVKARKRSPNQGASASGAVALLIRSMPVIKMAKPRKIWPMPFWRSLPNMNITMPAKPSRGAQASGLSIWMMKLSPCRPVRESSQAVTVVPTLAPMMTPTAW